MIEITKQLVEDAISALGEPASQVQAFARSLAVSPPNLRPLTARESAAVATDCAKTAALCFDRVWSLEAPPDVGFYAGTATELEQLRFNHFLRAAPGAMDVLSRCTPEEMASVLLPLMPQTSGALAARFQAHGYGVCIAHIIAYAIESVLKRSIPVVFRSQDARKAEYERGSTAVIVATLSGLEVVSESDTTWEQVIEFRKDADVVRKYRRLVHWLDKEMVGKSTAFIQDEIAERIEGYRWSLRKHGLKTVLGALKTLLDKNTLIAGSVASAIGAIGGGEFAAAASFVGAVMGGVGVSVAEQLLDLEDRRKTTNPEVAFVLAAQETLTPMAT